MIQYFFKNIYRNILRDKTFSAINFINLVIGFSTFILFSAVVTHELNYDRFNEKYDRIYRVQTRQEDSYPTNYCTYSPAAFRDHLMADLPEVEQALLMREVSGQFFTLPAGEQLYQKYGYWSENSFFDIFTITLIEGNKQNVLTEPNTIALSETLAGKLFPEGNAMGKQVTIGKRFPFIVTAVYEDIPENSFLRASYLISMESYESVSGKRGYRDDWTYIDNDNFVLLKEGSDSKQVDAKIKDAFKEVKNYEKSTPYLHPLSKLHTSPNNQSDLLIGLSILSLAAVLVLILSCVNYVNLSLANSSQRSKEIGIKKVVGFSRKALAGQFMAETIMMTSLATLIGILVAQISFPLLNHILQKNFEFSVLENGQLLLIVASVSLLAGVLSGLYPSVILSGYNPVKVLKGKIFDNIGKSFSVKKALVVTQYSISLFMLIVSFMLYRQVNFLLNKDLGFDNKNILFSEINVQKEVDFEIVKNRMLQYPEIAEVSFSS
ncbi:MAG: ABC transporter permease, partial [Bacteroidales bacterium]|nr:ABC transporter permease [Bacteroidales bacterium]